MQFLGRLDLIKKTPPRLKYSKPFFKNLARAVIIFVSFPAIPMDE